MNIIIGQLIFVIITLSIVGMFVSILRKIDGELNNNYISYANLIKEVSIRLGDEKGSKCGYDLFMGLICEDPKKSINKRYKAWKDLLIEIEKDPNCGRREEERDGVWVPSIPLE